jgi:ParB-like chromosome segregation protein Spo0J
MKVAIREIKPNTNNPRFIKDDKFRKLVKSIKEFPEMLELRPIVVDSDMIVLGGNMRLKACIEAGLTEVPILVADQLTEEQKNEFIVKDNVGFGEWDWDLLANEWDTYLLEEWGLDLNIDAEQEESFATDVTVTLKMNNEYLDELKEDLDKLLAKHTNVIVKIK